jgi:hypothetical protein
MVFYIMLRVSEMDWGYYGISCFRVPGGEM